MVSNVALTGLSFLSKGEGLFGPGPIAFLLCRVLDLKEAGTVLSSLSVVGRPVCLKSGANTSLLAILFRKISSEARGEQN